MKRIELPLTKDIIAGLRLGEEVLLNGPMLTGRDAAHKRLVDSINSKKALPVDIKGETIYYTGPAPARPGEIIGSCGPTTSSRMDPFTPTLIKHGLLGMIGKGERSKEVAFVIHRYGAIYFVTIGGAGAYLSECVVSNKVIAYEDLGPEAISRIIVKDFPVIVFLK